MVDSTLVYSSTTITFDSIQKVQYSRGITNVYEQGDLSGKGVVESAGASLLKLKITFVFKTEAGKTALQKLDEFDTLVQNENENTMTLTLVTGSQSQQFTGKITGVAFDQDAGEPDLVLGSLSFTVETKGSVT